MKKKRKRRTKKSRIIELRIKFASLIIVIFSCIGVFFFRDDVVRLINKSIDQQGESSEDQQEQSAEQEESWHFPWEKEKNELNSLGEVISPEKIQLTEKSIYSFMQGPKAWNTKTDWSGEWCEEALAGSKFSIFGCGLCDLANIYSTLTSYECSPIDMYHYARTASSYSPGGGVGAIDWPEMEDTLASVGFTCEIRNKDDTYEEFCNQIANSLTSIVLVSSYADSSYWKNTEGHYVNLWMYNPESDLVFLADSGDPAHNRSWIPLRYVYDALKTYGSHQYMLIHSYDESKNSWRYSGIHEDWAAPDYYRMKENAD